MSESKNIVVEVCMRKLGEIVNYWFNGTIKTGKIISIAMKNKKEVLIYEISKSNKIESDLVYPQNIIE